MDRLFEELDFRKTPIGDLILQRRKVPQLDGQVVYEVKPGDAFLMSSMFHEVEAAQRSFHFVHSSAMRCGFVFDDALTRWGIRC